MENFPKIQLITDDHVKLVLQRIVELRDKDITEYNELKRLNSYQSGFYRATLTIDTDYLVGLDDLTIDADATTGNILATLSSSPTDGETHRIAKSDVSANTVTIDGDGININGAATLVLAAQYDVADIVYMGGSGEWRVF